MKKILVILLVVCLFLAAACTPSGTITPTPEPTAAPPPAPTGASPAETPIPADPIGAAEMLQLQSDARWVFEQHWLPNLVFILYGEEIAEYIRDSDVEAMRETLISSFEFVTMRMAMEAFIDSLLEDPMALPQLLEDLRLDEHIVEVTIETLDEDTGAFLIKMLDIDEVRRSTYIAIVYSETEGFAMFTLEQSYRGHMFCFVGPESRGSFFAVENNRDAFIEAIIEVLETGEEAGAVIFWAHPR